MKLEFNQLDYNLIIERIQKHKEGYDVATGKDIVFFIGNTGAGKTTTILYLAGKQIKHEMKKFEVEGVELEDFVLNCSEAMPGFVIGHQNKSETVAANSFECSSSGLTYVDFAGQVDTQGHEIEIANTVGLFNTLSRAHSVRLVLVVDFESMDKLRGQIFKKCIEFLGGFVPNLNDKYDAISVLFTHSDGSKLNQLKVKVAKLKPTVPPELGEFIDHLFKYVNQNGAYLLIEPTESQKREYVVSILKSSTPLVTQPGSFQFFLPHESRVLVVERLKGVLVVVQEYLRSYAWAQVKQPMDELLLLRTEMSMMQEIIGIYDNAVLIVVKAAQDLVAKIHTLINLRDYTAVGAHLDHLAGASRLQDHIQSLDIKTAYRDIREIINSKLTSIEGEIEDTESYAMLRQQLDVAKAIVTHLSSHLTDPNKVLATKLEIVLQNRAKQQFTDATALISTLGKEGNCFVETKEKYLTDLLANLLGLISEVDKLFEGCTYYLSATEALNQVLASHYTKFTAELPKEPVPAELQLSFKVLKDFSRCQSLVPHASADSQSFYSKAEKAILHLLDELNGRVGMYSVSYDFAPIVKVTTRIHALAKVDQEVCSSFMAEKFDQTILQMQTLVSSTISEVKKKADDEISGLCSIDGCKFIRGKAEVLSQAVKIEREFEDPTMVSSFLSCLHDSFIVKARKLLSILEGTLHSLMFSDSPHGKELCTLLEVGVIPEVAEQFQVWITKFQEKIHTTEQQVKLHTKYADLADDFKILGELQQFNTSFLLSGRDIFNTIATKITLLINSITEKIKLDWKEYHEQFLALTKSIGTQLPAAELEKLKVDMVALIQKLRDIQETNMEQHINGMKPTAEIASIVRSLKSVLSAVESDTKVMIAVSHFDNAEKNLPVIALLCDVLNCVDAVEGMPVSTISSSLREKRLNLAQQIPEKLQRNNFGQVASILKNMKESTGEVERKEFENSCLLVEEHFADLIKAVRCTTIESVHAAIQVLEILNKASSLDALVPEIGIPGSCTKVSVKIKGYVDKNVRQFRQLLADNKFSEACALVDVFEDFMLQYPEMSEFAGMDFQGEIKKHVNDMPTTVSTILETGKWNSISKIDKMIEQLDNARDKLGGIDVDEIISAIQANVLGVAKAKDGNISKLVVQFKTKEAHDELDALSLLCELKCLADFKSKGVIKKREEDLNSSRISQFSSNALKHDPVKLSEDLATMQGHSYSECAKELAGLEKLCGELASGIIDKLDTIYTVTGSNSSIALKPVAADLECFRNIANAFTAKHQAFAQKLYDILDTKIMPKLQAICDNLQSELQKATKAKQWENAETTLKAMGVIARELSGFVQEEFADSIICRSVEIRYVASATADSAKLLKELNLFEPINIDVVVTNLSKLKDNASTRTHIELIPDYESYDDIVSAIMIDAAQKENECMNLWKDKKYEKIVTFLHNLQQGPRLAKHATLATGFAERYKSISQFISKYIVDMEAQANECFKAMDLSQLEDIQRAYTFLFAHFSPFNGIFPSAKNTIVTTLVEAVSKQRQEFVARFQHAIPELEDAISVLVSLKTFSSSISSTELAPHVHTEMNILLNFMLAKKGFDFFKLGADLRAAGPLGAEIVEGDNFPQFKALVIAMMNDIIARMTPEDALVQLAQKNKWAKPAQLQLIFGVFSTRYEELLVKYLMASSADLDNLVMRTKASFSGKDGKRIRDALPEQLAAIFTVWSVSVSKALFEESKDMKTVLQPHPIQILTLFCMLGLDSPAENSWLSSVKERVFTEMPKLKNHLVQIGTGEGKSVILGMLSTVLALLGFEVSCACYSSYLSERDRKAFSDIFTRFGVDEHIRYSTLAQLAGKYINDQGDIRQLTKQFVEGESIITLSRKSSGRPKVLLIDEVDTFLSRDFFGATYNPCFILKDPLVNAILEYIWEHPDSSLATIKALPEYKNLDHQYTDISRVIEGAVQRMLIEVKNVNNPPYFCAKNELGQMVIGYKENGAISTNIQHGYKTSFAYLQARDRGLITKEVAQNHLGLAINCGQFSYAEIPKFPHFQCILGVTGTLQTLCAFEKKIKNNTYGIEKETYAPSIYGDSRLVFQKVEDVHVMSDLSNYHLQLLDTINKRQKANQPVLVFFDSELQLDTFATSTYGKKLKYNIIRESTENIDFWIRKSTRINEATKLPEVTFLPRVFGRGMDFACRDDRINTNHGIHVIQAFLSADESEEIQIKGRTARQGKPGSYCLILNQQDLTAQFDITPKQVEEHKHASKLYQFLHDTRVAHFEEKNKDREEIINRSKQIHVESLAFRDLFKKKNRESIKKEVASFLYSQNPRIKTKSRIVCISDATGSMASVWDNAKAQVVEMVQRIITIGGPGKSELMWVAYRDYSDDPRLESSEWSNNPETLRAFINKIVCKGGDDYPEAVELGLEHANKMEGVTRVILIADAPPHLEPKGTKLASHKVTLATDYREQAALLAKKGIPVYCFYMNEEDSLVQSFNDIASLTGGEAALFGNVKSLIDVVAENVLDDIGGDEMVLEYRKTYHS